MQVLHTIEDFRTQRAAAGPVALVPTMGALHKGHLSLIQQAKSFAPTVAVSIFVNPTQFGPREDFSKYPRPIQADLALCESAGVNLIFNPPPEEMYRPGQFDVTVDLLALSTILEGKHRPGHFKGVCQVVSKLFLITTPQFALFGQKDYQQLRIIQAMTESLNFPIKIIPCPTLRDPDGLAMSSRNQYLSPEERTKALSIPRALAAVQLEFNNKIRQTNRLITTIQHILLEQHLSIDYVAAVDPNTLKPVEKVDHPTLIALAVRVGATRLIDNLLLTPDHAAAQSIPAHLFHFHPNPLKSRSPAAILAKLKPRF